MNRFWSVILVLFVAWPAFGAEDILIADFEGQNYDDWTVEGEAFGTGPAQGTLPNQMEVSGFEGKGLVNSYLGGDASKGTLTSPPFIIERDYINFLIGGGGYKKFTCMNLIVDGEIVRTATGPNMKPGGQETLHWNHWDVSDLRGEEAIVEIVDKRSKGWGHINVDQIMQSNAPFVSEATREIAIEKRYLNLPVKNGATKKWIRLLRGDEILREFDIELAMDDDVDFWVFLDLEPFKGETLTVWGDQLPRNTNALDTIVQADEILGGENMYQEKYRPQFHFSSKRGWNNDPNGMMYYDGEFHLFYQHNPYGWNWGNMTWGHAVSEDLVHWTELGDAIHPDALGTIYSGSGVVDWKNTTGFQTGDEPPLIAIFTYAGDRNLSSKGVPHTQGIAYSNDRGRTFTKYEGNPVQGHINGGNRDPKVIWYQPNREWVIVLYLDDNSMGFFTSKDLKTWELMSELECFHECPELFELPVDGDESNKKWVLYGAAGDYFVGSFDGRTYTPDGEAIKFNYGDCFYASQTFSDVPEEDGRRIQIAWGRTGHPDMPFNQQMNFPVVLTLRTTDDGVRMFAEPVAEIAKLHTMKHQWTNLDVVDRLPQPPEVQSELLHIRAEFEVGDAEEFGFSIGELFIAYDAKKQELRSKDNVAPLAPVDGVVSLELLVDRLSVEVFANGGEVYMPMAANTDGQPRAIISRGGTTTLRTLEVIELESAWK